MNCQGWYSKQDIVQDLIHATGKNVRDFEDGQILVGKQPPRLQPVCDEETKLQLLRLNGGDRSQAQEEICKPDLAGITEMLRMVDSLSEEENQKSKENLLSTSNMLLISKLNPNIEEFIPKNSLVVSPVKGSNANKTKNSDIVSNLSYGCVDTSLLTLGEVQNLRGKLKSKISDTSKSACVKVKRERNLAIATLLKLYCKSPPVPDFKPKLIAPDYFEKSADKSSAKKYKNISNAVVEQTDEKRIAAAVDKVQKWLHASENAQSKQEIPKDNNNIIDIENNKNETDQNSGKDSIESSKKGNPLYLGSVTFKRKAPSKSTSPASNSSVERIKNQRSAVYVPSTYANELSKTYMQRNKVKEALEHDIWTKLEIAVKAKDDKIKKRQESSQVSEAKTDTKSDQVAE